MAFTYLDTEYDTQTDKLFVHFVTFNKLSADEVNSLLYLLHHPQFNLGSLSFRTATDIDIKVSQYGHTLANRRAELRTDEDSSLKR